MKKIPDDGFIFKLDEKNEFTLYDMTKTREVYDILVPSANTPYLTYVRIYLNVPSSAKCLY